MKLAEHVKRICEDAYDDLRSQDLAVNEKIRNALSLAKEIDYYLADLNKISYSATNEYTAESYPKSIDSILNKIDELKPIVKEVQSLLKSTNKAGAKLKKASSQVAGWWIVFPESNEAYKAEYKNRNIYSGGDLWQFGKLGGTLVAEMGDGSYQIRHNTKFNFQDHAGDEIAEIIRAAKEK